MARATTYQNSSDFEEHIRDLLECPVCTETIKSVPVYQCANGHVICKDCIKKLNNCPICRNDSAPARSLQLEKIVQRLEGVQPENEGSTTPKPNLQKWGKGSARSYGTINAPNLVTRTENNLQTTSRQAMPRQSTPRQFMSRQQATTRQAMPRQQATTRQATPLQATPRQATPRQQASPRQQAMPRQQATPRQAAPRQAAPRQATPRQATIMINNQDVGAALQGGQAVSSRRRCCYLLGTFFVIVLFFCFLGFLSNHFSRIICFSYLNWHFCR